MSSKLNGLDVTLSWSDYANKPGPAPGPNQSQAAAFTFASVQKSRIHFARGASEFELVDDVTVDIVFDRMKSWVMNWAVNKSAPFPTDLLHHEQGHYTINALIARDFYVDVLLLRDQTFKTAHDGEKAVEKIRKSTLHKLQAVHNLYDAEVHPEQVQNQTRGPKQIAWDGYFQTATLKYRPFLIPFSEWADSLHHGYADPSDYPVDRGGPEAMKIDFKRIGDDYMPVCERLIDVLTDAGKKI